MSEQIEIDDQSGGFNNTGDVEVQGDLVGRDQTNITNTNTGFSTGAAFVLAIVVFAIALFLLFPGLLPIPSPAPMQTPAVPATLAPPTATFTPIANGTLTKAQQMAVLLHQLDEVWERD